MIETSIRKAKVDTGDAAKRWTLPPRELTQNSYQDQLLGCMFRHGRRSEINMPAARIPQWDTECRCRVGRKLLKFCVLSLGICA